MGAFVIYDLLGPTCDYPMFIGDPAEQLTEVDRFEVALF
jgi:hypothetical protein